MPRQPYLQVIPSSRDVRINLGVAELDKRPNLEKLIARCIMAWSHVEAEITLVLGKLLRSDASAAAMAVFQSIRKSQNQREAIEQAGSASLGGDDFELLQAIVAFHASVERERNALAHGHFGIADTLPQAYIWMETPDFIKLRSRLSEGSNITEPLLKGLFVYREKDLLQIFETTNDLGHIWRGFISYLDLKHAGEEPDRVYQALSSHAKIAQELALIRRRKTQEVQG